MSVWKSALPLLVWLILTLIPHPSGLTASAWCYNALFAAVVVGLVLEPIPASAVGLVGVTFATALGFVSPTPAEALKWGLSGFSDGTVWLIFGALVFSTGYDKTGLGRRIALTLVRMLGKSTLGLGYAVMLADLLIAPVMPSNTGRSAGVVFPIVRSIPGLYGSEPGPTARRIGAYLMWTAFATTTITSSLFLTALAPNLLSVDLIRTDAGISISWTQWLVGFLPVGLILLVPLPLLVYRIYPPEIASSPEVPAWAASELARMGRLTIREAILTLLILLAVSLWVFGAALISPPTVILVVLALLLVARVIDWGDVISNRAAWDMLIYFGTLLTLADGLHRLGIVKWVSTGVSRLLDGYPPLLVMVALVAFYFLVHYLFASLTAHATAVLPPLLAVGLALPGMPVRTYVLLLAYALGLMGVIAPYATGPAFAYYGSGFIARKDFWRLGFIFGLIFLAALLAIEMPFLLWMEGALRGTDRAPRTQRWERETTMGFEIAAIVLALVLLMVLAYRGLPVIVFAPVCAALAVGLSGRSILPSYTETFMAAATGYIRSFFPLFLLGAVFGKLMETSGAAGAIAGTIARTLGPRHAILAVVVACAVLTYGGISLFVVAFAVYPFAALLFRTADIPKRLLPGTIALGAFTLTMDALPGTPQIQNLIPTRYFGTNTYAAPLVGIVGGAAVLGGGLLWLERGRARAAAAGEGYGTGHRNEPDPEAGSGAAQPGVVRAVVPLLVVLIANYVLSLTELRVARWYPAEILVRDFPTLSVAAAAPTWALIVALLLGILATVALYPGRIRGRLSASLSAATTGALLAMFNTASEVGFGNLVKTLPGFQAIQKRVFEVSRHVLVSEAVAVNVLAGITGSASGGLSIALEVMGKRYLALAEAQGVSAALLHRIAAMASGGMDTLPHNGAVITLLAIAGLTHRQSYRDIFAITVLKTIVVFALAFTATALG